MKTIRSITLLAATAALLILAAGCAAFNGPAHRRNSSVVQFLYPEKSSPIEQPTVPALSLPLRVGVAFVPEDNHPGPTYGYSAGSPFTEKEKIELIKHVRESFKAYPFVQSIDVIPSAYLTPKGGFVNLDQLRSMFGIDVIVLLSYDQMQFTDEGLLSLSYWTIVGAYVFQGEKNDTKTMMDAAVYDIPSRKLLFRAPGISQIKASATPINFTEQLRGDSERGFQQASTNLIASLHEQLEEFKVRVKESPQEYHVSVKPGHVGLESFGLLEVMMLAGLGGMFLWTQRQGEIA